MEKGTPKSVFRWLYLEALALFIYLFIYWYHLFTAIIDHLRTGGWSDSYQLMLASLLYLYPIAVVAS